MGSEDQKVGNQQNVVLNNEGLRQDIKDLAGEVRSGMKEINATLTDVAVRLVKLEVQQQKVQELDLEFKKHVQVMEPIKEEVLAIKKLGHLAMWAAGGIPVVVSALLAIWHPWDDNTREQLAPVLKQLQDMTDVEKSDINGIHTTLQDQGYKITNLQTEVSPPQPQVSIKRLR